jgi:hypothetical protein
MPIGNGGGIAAKGTLLANMTHLKKVLKKLRLKIIV